MPFRRFFDKSAKKPAEPEVDVDVDENEADAEEVETGDAEEVYETEAVAPESVDEIDWRRRAAVVLPMGTSTGSKRMEALYGSAEVDAPSHFRRAIGCRVWDIDETEYLDCTMALGSVALGYAEPNISRVVMETISNGHISGLSPLLEVDVAERLCGVIPCAEMVQFVKTGAEATSAAVRIARTYTGRDHVIGCGYFGWHDWSSTSKGVPSSTQGHYSAVPFDDIAALDAAVSEAGQDLAAIVIEPVIERMPSPEWIARARAVCDATGAVLVFDEMKTGFRLRTGGYQELSGVTPDLATFGKAMANGYPLAAVVGKRPLMETARDTWISSTLAGESLGLVAALGVLSWHEQADICDALWSIGRDLQAGVSAAIAAAGVSGVTVDGIDPMWMLRFDAPARETRFLELAAKHGILFKRGAYNYAAMAHDDDVIRDVEAGASAAFVDLAEEERRR